MAVSPVRVAIIGCGRADGPGRTGTGISHMHAAGYKQSPDAQLVALADIVPENADAFRDLHFPEQRDRIRIYTDYRTMLSEQKPDLVSICTWPKLHCEMVLACVEAGIKAIHCEKPIAPTFGEAKRMVSAAQERGTQLTFNHQRRFAPPIRKAKELVASGVIGQLLRIETICGNLYDWGTHYFDSMFFYSDDTPAEWVLGQIDMTDSRRIFGALVESQGLSYIKFKNGVYGLMTTGYGMPKYPHHRLLGTDGMIEVMYGPGEKQFLRYQGKNTAGWQNIPMEESVNGVQHVERAIQHIIDCMRSGEEPELSARRAMGATEVIFATYESSRRRGRVDLPLTIEDSPIEEMLAERSKTT